MGYKTGTGFNFKKQGDCFVVETPEGKIVGTNSGAVLEEDNGNFKLSFDVFSCSFTIGEINMIASTGCDEQDVPDAFNRILALFP